MRYQLTGAQLHVDHRGPAQRERIHRGGGHDALLEGCERQIDVAAQMRQVLKNIAAVLAEGGAKPEHVVRMTWYVVDMDEYRAALPEIGAAYREIMGRHFPAMALVEVKSLVEREARLEIEATAVLPE